MFLVLSIKPEKNFKIIILIIMKELYFFYPDFAEGVGIISVDKIN